MICDTSIDKILRIVISVISFLSSPKSFDGQVGKIQKNAIRSWQNVHPDAEVLIYGDSIGAKAVCQELGVNHVADIHCSQSGVPYFNSIVEHAKIHARHDIQVYLNCDILMCDRMINAVTGINLSNYLIVGQRIDLADGVQLSMSPSLWKDELQHLVEDGKAVLHLPSGMDYFVFTRGMWQSLPPLVIGRGGYDAALVADCLRHKIPLIDATYAIPAFHQFHDYGHIAGAQQQVLRGKDAIDNYTIHNIKHSRPNSADAEWQIIHGKLVKCFGRGDWLRRIELYFRFVVGWSSVGLSLRLLWRLLIKIRLYHLRFPNIKDVIAFY